MTVPKTERALSWSIAIPTRVLVKLRAWLPASAAAFAIATISVTLGESFVITGRLVDATTALTASPVKSELWPKSKPPSTLGQLTLISIAAIPGVPSMAAAKSRYSSIRSPAMLRITGTCQSPHLGACSRSTTSMPGFWSPMEFIVHDLAWVIRGVALPRRG